MYNMYKLQSRPGFMLLDALMGAALFAVFLTAVGSTILVAQRSFLKSGDYTRGVFVAEKTLEAVRSIRNDDWGKLLSGGPYGIAIGDDRWELTGTGSITEDGYSTWVTLTSAGTDAFLVTVHTEWSENYERVGFVELSTRVTDWREEQEIGDWSSLILEGSATEPGTPLFNKITVRGDYAFVTSDVSAGGAGLYVFDISDLGNPSRVASSFALSGNGHNLLVTDTRLFVAVEDAGAEVQVYDISSPSSLSTDDLLGSINLSGDGRARSLGYYDGTLTIGATHDATESEVYSYSVTASGGTALLDTFDTDGSLNDVILKDGYAFFSSAEDVAELRVIDIFDPANLQNASGNGYNLTDVYDGTAVAGFGTGMFLGRTNGEIIEELVLFNVATSPVPSPPPGPFYYEIAGSVNDIVVEPGGRYAFIASDFSDKELQIVIPDTLVAGQAAEATFYDSADFGQGVYYELARDRLFFVSSTTLFIFRSAS
jgi:hypothetical protein